MKEKDRKRVIEIAIEVWGVKKESVGERGRERERKREGERERGREREIVKILFGESWAHFSVESLWP